MRAGIMGLVAIRRTLGAGLRGVVKPTTSSTSRCPCGGSARHVHEIKHDGYRLIVRRDANRVRLYTLVLEVMA
jgi:ATP-dependent DNA ligase